MSKFIPFSAKRLRKFNRTHFNVVSEVRRTMKRDTGDSRIVWVKLYREKLKQRRKFRRWLRGNPPKRRVDLIQRARSIAATAKKISGQIREAGGGR